METKPPTMRSDAPSTALRLPVPLVEALRATADAEGKTLAGVLREAAEAWLKERGRWPPKVGG